MGFTGQTDVFHYDIASPPLKPHVSQVGSRISADAVRENLRLLLATTFQNRRFVLQRRGARVFSVDELDRMLSEQDLGLRTFVDDEEVLVLHTYPRPRLVQLLSAYYTAEALEPLQKDFLVQLLLEMREHDLADAALLRSVHGRAGALCCVCVHSGAAQGRDGEARAVGARARGGRLAGRAREAPPQGAPQGAHTPAGGLRKLRTRAHARVQAVRVRPQREDERYDVVVGEFDSLSDSAARAYLEGELGALPAMVPLWLERELVRARALCTATQLREELEATGMSLPLDGDFRQLAFRYRLWKEIEHKSALGFAEVLPDQLSLAQLKR